MGLANATCSTMTTRDVVLFAVALPDNTGSPYSSTNLAYPQVPGTADRFSKWKIGSPPGAFDPSGITAGLDTDHAAGSSVAFQGYPKYLLDMFGGLIPRAAYGGLTRTQSEWNPLYLVQFNAGALSALTGAYSLMNANMGQPSVWVSGDPTSTMPSLSNITDTCTPLSITATLLGQDPSATYTRATSPSSAATAFFLQYAASQRDLDQDGFENALDTCPLNPNVGSPKTGGGDVNGDGIDAACDPNDNAPSNSNVDGDSFLNRADNCPQIANTQADSETSAPADNGPRTDAIGDACDSGTAGGTGTGSDHCTGVAVPIRQNGQCITISLSTTVANGRYLVKANVIPKCIGGPDLDGDGYCSVQDNIETGTCASTSPPSCTVRHNAWSTMTSHPGLQMDSDQDGYSDVMETYLGTDATKSCAQTRSGNDEAPLDNNPMDFNDDQLPNLSDVLKFANVWNTSVNTIIPNAVIQPSTRFDYNNDGQITIADILRFAPIFSFQCGVTIGAPPAWSQQ